MTSYTIQPYRLADDGGVVIIANINTPLTDIEEVKEKARMALKSLSADGVRVVHVDNIIWQSSDEEAMPTPRAE